MCIYHHTCLMSLLTIHLQVPALSMRDVILAMDYPEFFLHDVEGLKIILSAYHNAVNVVSVPYYLTIQCSDCCVCRELRSLWMLFILNGKTLWDRYSVYVCMYVLHVLLVCLVDSCHGYVKASTAKNSVSPSSLVAVR